MLEGRTFHLIESAVNGRAAPSTFDVTTNRKIGGIKVTSALRGLE